MTNVDIRYELKRIKRKVAYLSESPSNSYLVRELVERIIQLVNELQSHREEDHASAEIDFMLSGFHYDLMNLEEFRHSDLSERRRKYLYRDTYRSVSTNIGLLLAEESPIQRY